MRHGPGVDDAAAGLDRLVGHDGDAAVGDVGLELGRLDDLVGVEAHDQVLAGCGQAQGPSDGRRDGAVDLGQLVVEQGAGELDGQRRRVLLDDGDGVGPAGLDGGGGLVQRVGALAQGLLARRLPAHPGGFEPGPVPVLVPLSSGGVDPLGRGLVLRLRRDGRSTVLDVQGGGLGVLDGAAAQDAGGTSGARPRPAAAAACGGPGLRRQGHRHLA